MRLTGSRTIDDAFYGELKISTSDTNGRIEVVGEQVPTVVIQRAPEADLDKYTPIGTRALTDLTMTVDDVPADLQPGKGKLRRGSYLVTLTCSGTHYTFKPNSAATAQLRRDDAKIVEFSMGNEEGDFLVQWLAIRDNSQPGDAAIGYALSVAFGTGAMGFFSLLMNLPDMLIPG